ncbi:MAG: DUF192 domain-containing protein [Vicinamibacterales bacterium]
MASFLTQMRNGDAHGFVLRNQQTGTVVATHLLPAFDSKTRNVGLLGRRSLDPGTAMIIAPTNAVHTFFMRFPIDIAFVQKDGRILKIRERLPAWRMAAAWGAYAVVEMPAGSFDVAATAKGDFLEIARP